MDSGPTVNGLLMGTANGPMQLYDHFTYVTMHAGISSIKVWLTEPTNFVCGIAVRFPPPMMRCSSHFVAVFLK
jgi:hypothetical protein